MSARSSSPEASRLAQPVPLEGVHPVKEWPTAQEHTNFVIVAPKAGSDWTLVEPTVRGESPRHHSTVRFFLESRGRRLRVKQYFHDWWIPTIVDISFRRPGAPLPHDHGVAFVGRDYRRHEGSCGHRWGTGTEFSVEAGTMSSEAWTDLWSSLDAVVPAAARGAKDASFARRNYWNRYHRVDAPWDTTEISRLSWTEPTSATLASTAWAIGADAWAPLPGVVDSLGERATDAGREVQAVFRSPMTLNCTAWLRVLETAHEPWRPLIDAGEVNRPSWQSRDVGGRRVEEATLDASVGNWLFAWRSGPRAYELHLRAEKGLDRARAERAVAGVLHGLS